jgi:hypothetical protein
MLVTIAEAARRLRLSEYTIRRRLRTGELPGEQVPTPQGYVWMVEVDDEPPDTSADGEVAALISVLREQLEAKDKQIEQLHILLQQAQSALPAPRNGRPWWRVWRRD